MLKKLISESVSFTILSACEIEISDHEFSFDYINQFVSIKTLSVLGTKLMILPEVFLQKSENSTHL